MNWNVKIQTYLIPLWLLIFVSSIFSQHPDWIIYDMSNSGLPDDRILSLAIDANGNKWIGTAFSGLAVFDGANWTIYNTSNSGFPNNLIRSIWIDGDGNRWIATHGGGLAVYNQGALFL